VTSVIVVYHSATGTTAQLAEAIHAGAAEIAHATLFRITGDDIIAGRFRHETIWPALDEADAIIFGSPTFMGGPSAQFKAFADASGERWSEKKWADKVAAGFTIGANFNGDQLHTLSYLSIFAAQHGMLWCSLDIPGGYDAAGRNRLGTQLGLVAQTAGSEVDDIDLATAHYLGRRVASTAKRLRGNG